MNRQELNRLGVVGMGLGAAVNDAGGSLFDLIVRITPRRGEILETADYDEALDHLCGNTVDRLSFKPATIVGAEDTLTGGVICRRCLTVDPARMSDRYRHLSPRELAKLLEQTGVRVCSQCGRDLK